MNEVQQPAIEPLRDSASEAEWGARVDFAACYRLCEGHGMSDMIYTHITARVPDEPDQFLINPDGMLFGEVTAPSLLKLSLEGEILYKPDLPCGLHPAGFAVHGGIHRARPDARSIMHAHTVACTPTRWRVWRCRRWNAGR